MKGNTKVYYDEEGDLLEIIIGKPAPSYYEEISDGIFERLDRKTGRIRGISIFNFRSRIMNKRGLNLLSKKSGRFSKISA